MPHLSRAQLRLLKDLNREDLIVDELSDDMRYLMEQDLAEPLYRPYTEAERSRHRAAGLTVVSRGALNGLKITVTGRAVYDTLVVFRRRDDLRFWAGFLFNAALGIASLLVSLFH